MIFDSQTSQGHAEIAENPSPFRNSICPSQTGNASRKASSHTPRRATGKIDVLSALVQLLH